jgi:hypothetical protein
MSPTISHTLLQSCPKTAQRPTRYLLRDRHGFLSYTLLQFLNYSRLKDEYSTFEITATDNNHRRKCTSSPPREPAVLWKHSSQNICCISICTILLKPQWRQTDPTSTNSVSQLRNFPKFYADVPETAARSLSSNSRANDNNIRDPDAFGVLADFQVPSRDNSVCLRNMKSETVLRH